MHAIHVAADQSLHWQEVATPQPAAGEVLIRVAAAGVNRADLAQRAGNYPAPPGASTILGMEVAGTISAVGEDVSAWKPGDAVCALIPGGGYAEYARADAGHCLPVPQGFSMVEAAALPEAFATAYLNLYLEAALQPGETVLLPAGASGVGIAAIQLCKLSGNPVYVSVGSREKLARCVMLGAAGGVVRGEGSLGDLVRGIDVILDPVGGEALARHMELLNNGGRVVSIAFMGGRELTVDLGRLLVKRLRLIGSTLRSRPVAEKAALLAALRQELWPHFEAGRLRPVLDRSYAIEEAEAAHAHMAANRNIGKIVLTLSASPG